MAQKRKKTFDSFLTYLAGAYYYGDAVHHCTKQQKLKLIRNPQNPYDKIFSVEQVRESDPAQRA